VPDVVRRRSGLLLRVLVSALLLGVVLAYADVGEMWHAVRDGDWRWFVAAIALMTVVVVTGGIRWRVLLEGAEITVPRLRASRVFGTSLILNNLLPTSVGGDAVRAWLVGKESGRLLKAATATIVDRATSVGCLFVVAWAALALDPGGVPTSLVGALGWVTAGLVGAAVVAALAAAGVRPILHRLPERVAVMIRDAWGTLRVWASSTKLIVSLVGFGLAYQVLAVLSFVAVGNTVGVDLSFTLAAVSVSIVIVAMLIPVSIGGLGVREGAFVLVLGQADVSVAQATLLSLLGVAVIVLGSAIVIAVSSAVAAFRPRQAATRAAPEA
jgi:glycosyltransferase 2 family protein